MAKNRPFGVLSNLRNFRFYSRVVLRVPRPSIHLEGSLLFFISSDLSSKIGNTSSSDTAVHCRVLVSRVMPVLPDRCAARFSQQLAALQFFLDVRRSRCCERLAHTDPHPDLISSRFPAFASPWPLLTTLKLALT